MVQFLTPAVTPLDEQGKFDEAGAAALYDFLIEKGTGGILALGSMGEFFAFSMEEKKRIIRFAAQAIGHRVPFLVGPGGTALKEVLELGRFAVDAGADGLVVVPPYYFALGGDDVFAWFDALAGELPIPIYIYNFPDRTGYDIPVETVAALARRHKNMAGIKDTVHAFDHTRELIKAIKPFRPDFKVYSGYDDNLTRNAFSGGDGCIAGLGNAAVDVAHDWVEAVNSGDLEGIRTCQRKMDRVMSLYAIGPQFVPLMKEALRLRGVPILSKVTAPLPEVTPEQSEKLRALLEQEDML